MVMIEVPSAASWSMRRSISSIATGWETWSYSLQYAQARLQRRVGMICARIGCLAERMALANMRTSRKRRGTAPIFRLTAARFIRPLLQPKRQPSLG